MGKKSYWEKRAYDCFSHKCMKKTFEKNMKLGCGEKVKNKNSYWE